MMHMDEAEADPQSRPERTARRVPDRDSTPVGPTRGDASVDSALRRNGWGFADSGFYANAEGVAGFNGGRYPLGGSTFPELLAWMEGALGTRLDQRERHEFAYPPRVPPPLTDPSLIADLKTILAEEQLCTDSLVRLRHGHGHALEEIYAINYVQLSRVPDLVVYPSTEQAVVELVAVARRHNACLVPYGGGTNVSKSLACPPAERRLIVSVDMSRLNKILWIDPVNRTASIQAGAVGCAIQDELKRHGFTLGHEPDSSEFSTLGGWIATLASGMKRSRYGNIEDLVLDMRVATSLGAVSRQSAGPRESAGIDVRQCMFGSEGTLGIITGAVVRLFPTPTIQRHDSIVFPTFEDGFAFLYAMRDEASPPASMRLLDNAQFQLGLALRPVASGLLHRLRRIRNSAIARLHHIDPEQGVLCTLLYEGTRQEVALQRKSVRKASRRFRGLHAGAANGRRGYELTYTIAYLRDFALTFHIVADSFETSVSWSRALAMCTEVKARIRAEFERLALPGRPLVACRITQIYGTGVCVYFYLAFHHATLADPVAVFSHLESCARAEVIRCGGSISHHHGIGKIRAEFLPSVLSPAAVEFASRVKQAVDPDNVFGIDNQRVAVPQAPETLG
jgi:alkyldihydroxyacetonephosphate synthase